MFKRLENVLKESRTGGAIFDFLDLKEKWPKLVGETLSKHSSPTKLSYKNLFIVTDHAAYSSAISIAAEDLKKKILTSHPHLKIKKLYFQVNPEYFKKISPSKANLLHKKSPKFVLTKREGENLFKFIEDDDLRNNLVSLFIQTRTKE